MCGERGVGMSEARRRFAQYAVLRAIASSARFSGPLVFKGGDDVLDFVCTRTAARSTSTSQRACGRGRPLLTKPGWRACSLGPSTSPVGSQASSCACTARGASRPERGRPSSRTPPGSATRCRTKGVTGPASTPDNPAPTWSPSRSASMNRSGRTRTSRWGTGRCASAPRRHSRRGARGFLQQKGETRNRNRPQDL